MLILILILSKFWRNFFTISVPFLIYRWIYVPVNILFLIVLFWFKIIFHLSYYNHLIFFWIFAKSLSWWSFRSECRYRSWVGIFSLSPLFFQRFLKYRKFCDFCARFDFPPGILSEHKLDPLKRARRYYFSFSRSKAPLVLTRSCLLKQQNKFCIGDIIN